jgi:hypothetical protein
MCVTSSGQSPFRTTSTNQSERKLCLTRLNKHEKC